MASRVVVEDWCLSLQEFSLLQGRVSFGIMIYILTITMEKC